MYEWYSHSWNHTVIAFERNPENKRCPNYDYWSIYLLTPTLYIAIRVRFYIIRSSVFITSRPRVCYSGINNHRFSTLQYRDVPCDTITITGEYCTVFRLMWFFCIPCLVMHSDKIFRDRKRIQTFDSRCCSYCALTNKYVATKYCIICFTYKSPHFLIIQNMGY